LTRNDDAEVLLVFTLQQLDKMLDEMRLERRSAMEYAGWLFECC